MFSGKRRGFNVIQHNTNNTATGEKPEYIPLSLASSKDVYHRNKTTPSTLTLMPTPSFRTGSTSRRKGSRQLGSGYSAHQSQGGAGERKVLLDQISS